MLPHAATRETSFAVDIHAHYFPESYLRAVAEEGQRFGGEYVTGDDSFTLKVGSGASQPYSTRFTDLAQRIADMDAQGVAVQAISLTAPMVDWGDVELSHLLARRWNDAASAAHVCHPDRLVGLAALPMLDPDRAIDELERARALPGIRGVYMGTHIVGRSLDEPRFESLWARIEAVDLPVFLHPVGPTLGRMQRYELWNLLGFPVDGTTAACQLLFGGVLDRHPGLRICLPHAGGVLPIVVGRLDHAWRQRPNLQRGCGLPSSYLPRFYYDTISHSTHVLRFLVERAGIDRVMLGSDYCFAMGDARPREIVDTLDVDPAGREMILGGTAVALLKL